MHFYENNLLHRTHIICTLRLLCISTLSKLQENIHVLERLSTSNVKLIIFRLELILVCFGSVHLCKTEGTGKYNSEIAKMTTAVSMKIPSFP